MRIVKDRDYGLNPTGKTGKLMILQPNEHGKIGRSMIPQPNKLRRTGKSIA